MPRRNDEPGFAPAEHLTIAVRALARLKTQVPADSLAGHYIKTALASMGHLENAMRAENLIPPPARKGSCPEPGGIDGFS